MSALSGHKAWVVQRLTALYIAAYILIALGCLLVNGGPDNAAQWRGLFSSAAMNLLTLGFFLALLQHAWIGIRDVILDYVRPVWVRFAVLILFGAGLLLCAVWVGRVLFNAMA